MTTEQGRKHFVMNLRQITAAVHTTAHFGVMHALLTGKNHYKEWRKKYDRTPKRRHNVMKYEKGMWALLQKDLKGLYILDAEVKHDMKMNGVTPNVMVLPSKAGIYAHMVPSSETKYSERGQGAHEALASGSQLTTFRGSKVFEAASFDVDFTHENIDLLTRDRMIGEYFVMPARWKPNTAYRDNPRIKIFCAEHDKFVEIDKNKAARYALNGDDARFSGSLLHTIEGSHFTEQDDVDNMLKPLLSSKRWNNAAERAYHTVVNDPAAINAASLGNGSGAAGVLAGAAGILAGIPAADRPNVVALLQISHLVGSLPVAAPAGGGLAIVGGAAAGGAVAFENIVQGDLDVDVNLIVGGAGAGAFAAALGAVDIDRVKGFQSTVYTTLKNELQTVLDALNLGVAGNNTKITVAEAQAAAVGVRRLKGFA